MAKTVKQLIEILKDYPQDSIVLLSRDEEGNAFHKFAEATNEASLEPEAWEVELEDPSEGEMDTFNVVVLWP